MKTKKDNPIKDRTMRFIYALSLFSILLFFGCDRGSDISSPFSDSTKMTSVPLGSDGPEGHEMYTYPKEDLLYPSGADSIFVPLSLPPSIIPGLEVSQVIDGHQGGKIVIDLVYQDTLNAPTTIWAELNIPRDAFEGVEEISMKLNAEIGTVTFYPHMVFNKPVELNMKYTGIDVSGIDPTIVDFIFQDYDGSTEQIDYYKIIVDADMNEIELKRAKLQHFSRYGWIRGQQ